ncbi:MAG: rhodanese-like domain-containing protein [Gammaproteobacteria bacterium]|nr:rhodanese-like domain-containing protein [Gammaproteobacteria bacterium]
MERYLEFAINHWEMVLALLLTLSVLLITERRKAAPSVSPQQATVMSNGEDALLLDIRTPADFKAGHVIGAKNIPFADLTKRITELEKHKDKPIIVICKTGQTASGAANVLKKAEFTNVHRMAGGMAEWTGQNLPLVRK